MLIAVRRELGDCGKTLPEPAARFPLPRQCYGRALSAAATPVQSRTAPDGERGNQHVGRNQTNEPVRPRAVVVECHGVALERRVQNVVAGGAHGLQARV